MASDNASADYTAEDVQVLRDTSHIRLRPGMYVGDTGAKGLHYLIWQVIQNSLDETAAGHCHKIDVEILADNSVRVSDDGRGIPVEMHPVVKRPALEVVMTAICTGARFDTETYKADRSLYGLGLKAVCALSAWCEAEVCRSGRRWVQRYSRGIPAGPIEDRGPADRTGTRNTFLPDPDIFRDVAVDFCTLERRLREGAFLNRGLVIRLADFRTTPHREESFNFPGGIVDYVRDMNQNVYPVHPHLFYCREVEPGQEVEVALQWTAAPGYKVQAYANGARLIQGTHTEGLRNGVWDALRGRVRGPALLPVERALLVAEDYWDGLSGVVALKIAEPMFLNAAREYLGGREVATLVRRAVSRNLSKFLDKHPDDAGAITTRVLIAQATRMAPPRR